MTITVKYRQSHSYRSIVQRTHGPYLAVRLQLGGRHIDTQGLVDSGAERTLFHWDFARALGINLDPTCVESLDIVGGNADVWYVALYMTVANRRMSVDVGFSPAVPPEHGLLGRSGFFDSFDVGLDQRGARLLLTPQTPRGH
jgi:hypothetical protein